MQRTVILVLAIIALGLAGTLAFVLLRGQAQPAPISIDAADENATEPYHREMNCIDRVLQNHDLNANEVEPALANCRGGASRNESLGQ